MTIKTPVLVEHDYYLLDAIGDDFAYANHPEQANEIAAALNSMAQVRAAFESGKVRKLLDMFMKDDIDRETELRKLLGLT